MKIVIGSDHAGVDLKGNLIEYLQQLGHEVVNVGVDTPVPVDYPDYAKKVSDVVIAGGAERGVLICGSGVGHRSPRTRFAASVPVCATTCIQRTRESSMTT